MSGIVIPNDRSESHPIRGYCYNPKCLDSSDQERFEFNVENDLFCCPKCGACEGPMVGMLVLIHLLVQDKNGPVKGAGGIRYRLACDSKRAYTATVTNLEAATGDIRAANCPQCLAAAEKEKLPRRAGFEIVANQSN